MLRLLLLRHAKTESESASGADRDRRLEERGRDDAAAMAGYLLAHDLLPGEVMVSSATRSQETWAIIEAAMPDSRPRPHVRVLDELYLATPSALLRLIRLPRRSDALMIVGHNPGLHELALMLCRGAARAHKGLSDNLPTSGLAVIDVDGDSWSATGFGAGALADFVTPKLLRESQS